MLRSRVPFAIRIEVRLLLLSLLAGACAPATDDTPPTSEPTIERAEPSARSARTPPNVVLIYVDDLGYGDLASYGHHTIETPNLDRVAAEGMRFTRYYAPSPLCSPSRAALLTGRTPFRTGIENWIPEHQDVQLGPEEVTLATLLRNRGYATYLGGKWHLNGGLDHDAHSQPHDHGFDEWMALHAFPVPSGRNPTNFFRDGEALGEIDGFAAGIVVDQTIAFLDRHRESSERPFFIYLATIEPHGTIASPPEYLARYASFTRGEPEPIPNGTDGPTVELVARGPGEYYANVTYLDAQIGRLLDYLDRHHLAEETLIFFASDNGPVTTDWRHWWEVNLYGSTGGLRGRKADLWDGGIRVPAMIRWPGVVPAGVVSEALIGGYDLLPTLAEVVGFDLPRDRELDGESFVAALRQQPFERRRPLYWQFDDDQGHQFAVRDERFKLLADRSLERMALYDMQADPFELIDLARSESPQHVAARERLLSDLRVIHRSVQRDPLRPRTDAVEPGYRGD